MSRDSLQYSKWRCYIDGVEVPMITASVSFGVNQNPMAQIMIEPDPVLIRIRPKSVVSLWFFDSHDPAIRKALAAGSVLADEDAYKLYFEGELDSVQYNKTPDSRNFTLVVSGLMGILGQFPMFMGGVGTSFESPLVSGSFFYSGTAADGNNDDFFKKASILGGVFSEKGTPNTVSTVPWRETKRGGFVQRLISVINYLGSFNASARMQIARTRLMGKMCGVEDSLFQRLLQLSISGQYFDEAQQTIGPGSTFADVVELLKSMAFYDMASIPAPFYGTQAAYRNPSVTPLPKGFERNEIYAIPRPFLRNDFVFMPNLYYAMPPRCNFLFPDMITSLTRTRSFMAEPTRLLIQDPYVTKGDVGILSPVPAVRASVLNAPTAGSLRPEAIWSTSLDAIQATDPSTPITSPYQIAVGSQVYNGLQMLRNEEIEKGLLLSRQFPAFEFFSALASSFDRNDTESLEAAARSTSQQALDFLAGGTGDTVRGQRWLEVMQAAANYQLDLQRQSRDLRVTCVGLRHIAPGFNAVIMDTTVSYLGRVESVTLDIDPTGLETTSITCGMVREIPPPPVSQTPATTVSSMRRLDYTGLPAHLAARLRTATAAFAEILRADSAQLSKILASDSPVFVTAKEHLSAVVTAILRQQSSVAKSFNTYPKFSSARVVLTFGGDLAARLANNHALFLAARTSIVDAKDLVAAYYTDTTKTAAVAIQLGTISPSTIDLFGFVAGTAPVATLVNGASDINPEWPVPPAHFPQEWLDAATLDSAYEGLLGTAPFYADSRDPAYTDGDPTTVTVSTAAYVSNTQEMLKRIDAVFPILPREDGQPVDTSSSEWGRRTSSTQPDVPVLDWELDEYHWRPAMTLGEYLQVNGLNPSISHDSSDRGVTFTYMTPALGAADNSVFSKIVDDNALKGLLLSADPAVDAIRAEATNANLTTVERQKLWREYARRHFGGSAFQGF